MFSRLLYSAALCGVLLGTSAWGIAQQQRFTITGQVLDKEGRPLKGIPVSLQRGLVIVSHSVSKKDGTYSIEFEKGDTLAAVAYLGTEFAPNVILNLSGARSHNITKVLNPTGGQASLTGGDLLESFAALEFLREYPDLYKNEIAIYDNKRLKDWFASKFSEHFDNDDFIAYGVSKFGSRISALDDYEIVKSIEIEFPYRSRKLSNKAKAELDSMATQLNLSPYSLLNINVYAGGRMRDARLAEPERVL
jgi:hypothetical protein